jgi:hypothetical protein
VSEADDFDLYEMANLYPADTGLPMTIWVSARGHAQHDVRIKVNMAHGKRMTPSTLAVVGVRPTPSVISGYLSSSDQQAVFLWIRLNEAPLVNYWEGSIGTIDLARRLRPLQGP